MRDIVWTVIVIWIVWKIFSIFSSKSKSQNIPSANAQNRKEGEVKIDKTVNQKSHFNANDGEYVDYEEIK